MRLRSPFSKARLLTVALVTTLWLLITGVVLAASHSQADSKLFDESPLPYLLGVYTVTWLAFLAYAFYMTRRQGELRRQIYELRRSLEEHKK